MDEETEQIINDIGGIIEGAGKLAQGFENPVAMVQGVVLVLTSAFDLFNTRDRDAERSIRGHAGALKELQKTYNKIERAIDSALGEDRYKTQKSGIENMREQQKRLSAMADAERSKKKTDNAKIEEYQRQIEALDNKIEDTIQTLRDDLIGGSAKDIASQLGNAFIEAFSKGENAAEDFGQKVDDIVKNIIQKMLIQKLLEKPVGEIINRYSKKWVNNKGDFAGFDEVLNNVGDMGKELKGVSSGFATAMERLPNEIKKYFIDDGSNNADASLSGAVKGVTEETASILAGQMNAIRINQMESTVILRQHLLTLSTIANNTSYNKHLLDIRNDIREMKVQDTSVLRSRGLA